MKLDQRMQSTRMGVRGRGWRALGGLTAAAAMALLALSERSMAQTPVDFSGKTITIVVGFPPGGDYDAYSRITANNLGQHLKGNPTVVVQNMPGAGGVAAANYLYNAAHRDGTILGVVAQTVAIAQITGVDGVKYDAGELNWIGRVNSNVEVQQLWYTSPVKTIADALVHEVTVAGTGATSSSFVFPNLLDSTIGTKFKVIPGYEGVNMATLAMERGEVGGIAGPWSLSKAAHPDWLRDKKLNTIVQYVTKPHPDLMDVPTVVSLAKDDMQRQIFALYASGAEIGRSILAPPGLPEPVVAALRAGFSETVTDGRFLAEIKKSGLEFDPLDGAQLQAMIQDLLKIPPNVVAEARRLTRTGN